MGMRILAVCSTLLLLIFPTISAQTSQPVHADVMIQNHVQLGAGESIWYNITLGAKESMACFFDIIAGKGVQSFIVDQANHYRLQHGGTANKTYQESNYSSNEERHYYWNFTAPKQAQWYVYFSKAPDTPYMMGEATLRIDIRKNTNPPYVHAFRLSGSVHGNVLIDAGAADDCFPIQKAELLLNGTVASEQFFSETNTCDVDISIVWHTYEYPNGWYNLSIVATDILGESGDPFWLGMVRVENGPLDNPNITHPIIGIGVAIALVGVYVLFARRMGYLEQK
ncbi:MAG: hypothetical protein GF309_06790 [Candidatus Lokiarchaeota archaeon]|nr:hypothetical protein [Candidatus Lokiarchaeota archaeon]